MILADIVLMWGFRNILIKDLISKAARVSSAVQTVHLQPDGNNGRRLRNFDIIRAIVYDVGSVYCLIQDNNHKVLAEIGSFFDKSVSSDQLADDAMVSGEKIIRFAGSTWGLFRKQKEYLFVASPLMDAKKVAGVVVIAFDLKRIYSVLRHLQKTVWSFLLFNLFVLAAIGLIRISRTTVKPIQRLLHRAEAYTEDDPVFFPDERKNNEFNRLSYALNRMLTRISEDRDRLRQTVSSLEKSNAELKKAQEDIVRVEKLASVGRLASGIAHEIGNPMGIILGYLGLLKQTDLQESDKRDYILRAEKETMRINSIIRQLLDFSRTSGDKNELFSVHQLIEEVGAMVRPQPFMAGITLFTEPGALQDMVSGDPNALRQVFLNLLINAADAIALENISEFGKIYITTGNIDSYTFKSGCMPAITVTFKDNGPGITHQEAQNIFDPFFTTKPPGKGTGLGLSVSFMLVENLGGTIHAVDNTGPGAEIAVILPLFQTT